MSGSALYKLLDGTSDQGCVFGGEICKCSQIQKFQTFFYFFARQEVVKTWSGTHQLRSCCCVHRRRKYGGWPFGLPGQLNLGPCQLLEGRSSTHLYTSLLLPGVYPDPGSSSGPPMVVCTSHIVKRPRKYPGIYTSCLKFLQSFLDTFI